MLYVKNPITALEICWLKFLLKTLFTIADDKKYTGGQIKVALLYLHTCTVLNEIPNELTSNSIIYIDKITFSLLYIAVFHKIVGRNNFVSLQMRRLPPFENVIMQRHVSHFRIQHQSDYFDPLFSRGWCIVHCPECLHSNHLLYKTDS